MASFCFRYTLLHLCEGAFLGTGIAKYLDMETRQSLHKKSQVR